MQLRFGARRLGRKNKDAILAVYFLKHFYAPLSEKSHPSGVEKYLPLGAGGFGVFGVRVSGEKSACDRGDGDGREDDNRDNDCKNLGDGGASRGLGVND